MIEYLYSFGRHPGIRRNTNKENVLILECSYQFELNCICDLFVHIRLQEKNLANENINGYSNALSLPIEQDQTGWYQGEGGMNLHSRYWSAISRTSTKGWESSHEIRNQLDLYLAAILPKLTNTRILLKR